MTIFQYAALEELSFENFVSQNGYTRKTTFYSDLSLADALGESAVTDTYKSVMKEWISNLEFITEFVMCLNLKSWGMYERGKESMSKLYSELYYKGLNAIREHYSDNEDALRYIFDTLD